jgi:Ca-activated chloride channel family protein
MTFSFGEPVILVFLLLVPLILYFYKIYQDKKRRSALKFSSLGMVKSASDRRHNIRLHLPFILILITIALIITGLADPRIPLKTAKEGVNVVLVIDDSGSMAATDYKPTRLEAAKGSAEILINSLKPKDNVGIVIFESGATTASYLTPFKDKAIEKLRAIEQREGKTAIGDGLSLAVDMATSIPNKKKVIILLSDGVNNAGVVSVDEAIQFSKANRIQVYTVGMGSEKPVVLGYDFFGNPQYAELDEQTLKRIAAETGGKYYKSVDKNTLDEIYRNIGENIEREWEDTSIKDWFFIAALVILLINIYIIYGKYKIVV